jgi:cell division cycle 20-like protein 1 (cofactor of APC complex)
VRQKDRYISTGGNDNRVNICDIRKFEIVANYYHNAAVKAMVWLSEKVLATGGGTADRKIKLWSEEKGVYKEIDTGSQVCSLCWSATTNEIVSCQGFSLNQIIIWSRNGNRQFTFHGHTSRVLYSALSPNG